MGTALLLGAECAALAGAREALVRAGWAVIEHAAARAPAVTASSRFDAWAAGAAPHLLVFVADLSGDGPLLELAPARLRELEEQVLVAPWEALREAARVLVTPASTVLLVAPVAGGLDTPGVFAAAARRALRTMVAAAAVEFAARDAPIRVNLLEYDAPRLEPRAYQRAVAFLASPASSFVTGTHLSLPGAAPERAARPP
jgi:hypothetical protein